ncbi:CGNR zinc finger domain-containing protein [Streptomyces gilvosporeus]|uniref:CGNR zinc finger domain-containing protein n=1 Tax=Streptomyces gilvosporeus TaxID=553510 RepID=UPI000D1A9DF3|nr:CGNR zinc finger domain-containing protein [Streptomyces gilvosporeus]
MATDLVNTAPLVRRSTGEVLVDPAALERFLTEHEVRSEALTRDGRPSGEDLDGVLMLRQEIRALLETTAEDDVVSGATALVMRAGVGPILHRDAEGHWQWHVATAPDATLADELAVLTGAGLLGALRTLGHDRFRSCTSPDCEGMFVDTSRAGRRRYCMPEVCGNRLNVANYRARQQGRGKGPTTRPRTTGR